MNTFRDDESGDDSFAEEVVRQSAVIIAKETAKVKTALQEEKNRREALEQKVEALEVRLAQAETALAGIPPPLQQHKCTEVLQKIFTAGLIATLPEEQTQTTPNLYAFPIDDMTVEDRDGEQPGSSGVKRKEMTESFSPEKRRKTDTSQKAQVCETLEDVPPPLRDCIEPFYKQDQQASKDLLNNVQRAYVKWKSSQSHEAGESLTSTATKEVIRDGISHKIWEEDFNPSDLPSFEKYLQSRLKNERKILRRKSLLSRQQDMVHSYLAEMEEGKTLIN